MSSQAVLIVVCSCLMIAAGVVILYRYMDVFFNEETSEHNRRWIPSTVLWGLALLGFGIGLLYKLFF